MALIKKILIIVLIVLVLFGGVTYIDYFLVKTKGYMPKIALKETDDVKQMITYKAPFYKVWYCKSDKSIIIGNYDDSDALCPRKVEYTDGFFTNSAGLKISQRNYELMSYNNIYTFDAIEAMTTQTDVENAAYVAEEYGKTLFEIKKDSSFKYKGDNVNIVVFNKFTADKDSFNWTSNFEKEEEYYCARETSDGYEFSKYKDESCEDNFSKITMSDKWCELYKTSTLVYTLEETPLCK